MRFSGLLPVLLLILLIAGCGGSKDQTDSNTVPAAQPSNSSNSTQTSLSNTSENQNPSTEQRWIGNIPYDVFFDAPLEIAAQTTPLATSAAESAVTLPQEHPAITSTETVSPAASASTATSSASGSQQDWGNVLPVETLVDEIKLIRTRLTENLQTVATFNRSTATLALDASILTALSTIIADHPEPTPLQPRAPYIRDAAYELSMRTEGSGREAFTKAKDSFQTVITILDGGSPPTADAEAKLPLGDVVYAADLMKRIDSQFSAIKSNINTEARFKDNPAELTHQLQILAALAVLISDESYDSADEEKYQQFARMFVENSLKSVTATKETDFASFQAALNQIQISCTECHQQYRGSGSGF